MLTAFKWTGIILGSLVGLVALAVVVAYFVAGAQLGERYEIQAAEIPVPTDAAAIERGRHIVRTFGFCDECHGQDLSGEVWSNDPFFGLVAPSNLTAGKGGIGATYSDADYVRAIRHGVGSDGRGLVVMPSDFYYDFSDEDLGAVIAYLKSLRPVDNELPAAALGPLGRVFYLLGEFPVAARGIDHTAPPPPAPAPGVTPEYGRYLALGCDTCHGDGLTGAWGPDLTPRGSLADWSEEDFIRAMRSGVTPKGDRLDNDAMPWRRIGRLTEEELKAMWLYFRSLAAE